MLEAQQQTRSPLQTDPATHTECLEFIRAAIASNDRQTARDIAAVVKEVCEGGHADRAAIWHDLTPIEQQQFAELLAPPLVREFTRRIREAIGYQSPAVAVAVAEDLERAINAGSVTAADVAAVVGEAGMGEFDQLLGETRKSNSQRG